MAAGVAAIVTGTVAYKEKKKVDDACPDGVCPADLKESADDRVETVRKLSLTTDILLGVTAVGVVGGVVLYFLEPRLMVSPVVSDETAGIVFTKRF